MRRVIARWVFSFVYPVVLASNCLLRAAGDGIEMNCSVGNGHNTNVRDS